MDNAQPPRRQRVISWVWLWLAVVAASTAASLIRLAALPALEAARLRLLLAGLVLLPFGLGAFVRRIDRATFWGIAIASIALAVHFGTWVESLALTSVASCVVLVTASPLFVLLWEVAAHEPVRPTQWLGALVSILGVALISGGDFSQYGRTALTGDGLALLGALAFSVYVRAGRKVRQRLPVLAYAAPVYTLAGLMLLAAQPAAGPLAWPLSGEAWLMTALLVFGPTLVGHTGFNYALQAVPASSVAMVALFEPLFAVLIAWPLLHTLPSAMDVLGGALAICGLMVFEWRRPRESGRLGKTLG